MQHDVSFAIADLLSAVRYVFNGPRSAWQGRRGLRVGRHSSRVRGMAETMGELPAACLAEIRATEDILHASLMATSGADEPA